DLLRNRQRANTGHVAIAPRGEDADLVAFHDQVFAAHHPVTLHEALAAPLGDAGVDLQHVAVAGGLDELRMGVDQRGADHAQRLLGLVPGRNAALDEEVPRGRVDPAEEVGKPDDACGVAVAELHLDGVGDAAAAVAFGRQAQLPWMFRARISAPKRTLSIWARAAKSAGLMGAGTA